MDKKELPYLIVLAQPVVIVALAFFLLPMARLAFIAGSGDDGWAAYTSVLTTPRYLESVIATTLLAGITTIVTLAIATVA